jgi:alkanesulfonate monooxygenase SsuD/methylene tetrahydromethanopterin reductase-like flavin-dependent oxidoreductase (luciferase family)
MPAPPPFHVAVALEGAGWHPAAWREPDAHPAGLFSASYWCELVQEAERGLLDFVTIEDSFGAQSSPFSRNPDGRTDRVRGRLDAVLIAARVAPTTSKIGIVPTAVVTYTEPFHISKAVATLDYVSGGRAGWRARVSASRGDAAQFGRRTFPEIRWADRESPEAVAVITELFDEAADYLEVVRRLWDSWEDDAEIRNVATGRFVDREKLHYIDFRGEWFSVKGPSITPRPPQGQPLVTALAHSTIPYRLAARGADVVFVTPHDVDQARAMVGEVRAEEAGVGRQGDPLLIFADLVVFLDDDHEGAAARKDRLDRLDGAAYRSDALVFTGTAIELADLLGGWRQAGLAGYRLRPGAIPRDLDAITQRLVPILQARGLMRREYEAGTLRGLLGLGRPSNRHAQV